MYFSKADFSRVSLFLPFPEIIAGPMLLVKWESSGCGWFPEVFVPSAEGLSIIRRTKSLAESILKARHYCSALQNVCSFGWGKEYFLEMCIMFFQPLAKIDQIDLEKACDSMSSRLLVGTDTQETSALWYLEHFMRTRDKIRPTSGKKAGNNFC